MRTSFHHQPEAQHPIFQLSTSWQADYPIFRGQSGHWLGDGRCPLLTQSGHRGQPALVLVHAAASGPIENRLGGGTSYLALSRNARISSVSSTTRARSCAFSASSCSS